MLITFVDRPSDSPFVERVWRSHSDRAGVFHSIAACSWDIVVMRLEGRTTLIVRGPETKATMADCPPQGEWFGVRFKPGTFMPLMRSSDMRDRNNVTLPNATRRSFWLNGSAWDFPDFENAEVFVNRLARAGLIMADRTVEDAIFGKPQGVSTRTEQSAQDLIAGIGVLLLVCTVLYAIPRTAILGAILLTGYLGGATAVQVVARSEPFPIAFASGFGALVWVGIILRDPRLLGWILLWQ